MYKETTHISASLPKELVDRLDALAALIERDRAWVLKHALEHYLASEGAELQEEAAGLAELQAGEFSELDDVLKKASTLIEHAEIKRSRRAG